MSVVRVWCCVNYPILQRCCVGGVLAILSCNIVVWGVALDYPILQCLPCGVLRWTILSCYTSELLPIIQRTNYSNWYVWVHMDKLSITSPLFVALDGYWPGLLVSKAQHATCTIIWQLVCCDCTHMCPDPYPTIPHYLCILDFTSLLIWDAYVCVCDFIGSNW